ncbi:putative gustatory receptor 2a [Venturia canescens]|uniref:putative gustatory receptor 2a n=1 Tax=Venturia canescens TaxID=32260 RepID=UPI001C9CC585|nr:putative gustatory receptor 2a [Venturia canescens]
MTSDLYMLCIMVKDKDVWSSEVYAPFMVIAAWLAFHLIETVTLVAISDSTVNEANRTGEFLHRMLTAANTENHTNAGQLLSLRLLHTHLNISLWGLVRMKLSVVYTILGTVITYITIMMQLDDENFQQGS